MIHYVIKLDLWKTIMVAEKHAPIPVSIGFFYRISTKKLYNSQDIHVKRLSLSL